MSKPTRRYYFCFELPDPGAPVVAAWAWFGAQAKIVYFGVNGLGAALGAGVDPLAAGELVDAAVGDAWGAALEGRTAEGVLS